MLSFNSAGFNSTSPANISEGAPYFGSLQAHRRPAKGLTSRGCTEVQSSWMGAFYPIWVAGRALHLRTPSPRVRRNPPSRRRGWGSWKAQGFAGINVCLDLTLAHDAASLAALWEPVTCCMPSLLQESSPIDTLTSFLLFAFP